MVVISYGHARHLFVVDVRSLHRTFAVATRRGVTRERNSLWSLQGLWMSAHLKEIRRLVSYFFRARHYRNGVIANSACGAVSQH